MTALRQTVLQLVVCGFLIAMCTALFSGERMRRLIRFAGGCFLALVILRPLLSLDAVSLLNRLRPEIPSTENSIAQEKNEQLLKELIESQTEEYIVNAAKELGADLNVEVACEKDEASGLFFPVRVTLRGFVSDEQRTELSGIIEKELAIEAERQRWVLQ